MQIEALRPKAESPGQQIKRFAEELLRKQNLHLCLTCSARADGLAGPASLGSWNSHKSKNLLAPRAAASRARS
jgi:hypothetical protein